jgi:uncharacterized protein (TIGR02646 family)
VRKLTRVELPLAGKRSLYIRSKECDSAEKARSKWKAFRQSSDISSVVDTLELMAGPRQRCAYCSDSHASDIDHFIPITVDHGVTFKWKNLLWVCARCNRQKGSRFPIAEDGYPLLIDPSTVDPWKHLTLDTTSGVIVPRYIGDHFDVFGEATLTVLPTINYEAVAEGRARICRRVISAVKAVNSDPAFDAISTLLSEVSEDDVGVSRWYGYWEGSGEAEMLLFKQTRATIWKRFLRACA